jgi:hypothetical protein
MPFSGISLSNTQDVHKSSLFFFNFTPFHSVHMPSCIPRSKSFQAGWQRPDFPEFVGEILHCCWKSSGPDLGRPHDRKQDRKWESYHWKVFYYFWVVKKEINEIDYVLKYGASHFPES